MSDQESVDRHPFADLDRMIHSPARLMVMTYLYVVESVDYVYLTHLTGLNWGNLATHVGKLEEALGAVTDGLAKVAFMDDAGREELVFSAKFACPQCGTENRISSAEETAVIDCPVGPIAYTICEPTEICYDLAITPLDASVIAIVVGTNAAKMACGLGAKVYLLDMNLDRLRYLSDVMPANCFTLMSSPATIRKLVDNERQRAGCN